MDDILLVGRYWGAHVHPSRCGVFSTPLAIYAAL